MKVTSSIANLANACPNGVGKAVKTIQRAASDLYAGAGKLASNLTLKQAVTALALTAPAGAKASYTPLNNIYNEYEPCTAVGGTPTVAYFTGPEGLAGSVVGNIQSGYGCGRGSWCGQYDAPVLVSNFLNLTVASCNVTISNKPNGADKPIPGGIEDNFYVAAYVNRYNDSQGLDPRVGCIFGLGTPQQNNR